MLASSARIGRFIQAAWPPCVASCTQSICRFLHNPIVMSRSSCCRHLSIASEFRCRLPCRCKSSSKLRLNGLLARFIDLAAIFPCRRPQVRTSRSSDFLQIPWIEMQIVYAHRLSAPARLSQNACSNLFEELRKTSSNRFPAPSLLAAPSRRKRSIQTGFHCIVSPLRTDLSFIECTETILFRLHHQLSLFPPKPTLRSASGAERRH